MNSKPIKWTQYAPVAAGSSAISIQNQHDIRQINRAKEVLHQESEAIVSLCDSINSSFLDAVDRLLNLRGSVIVTGIGKAGLIGQKIAATLASTGTPSHFLHPSEAIHGDLGRVQPGDVVLVLSNSGETEEVVRLLPTLKATASSLIAITSKAHSELARSADIVLLLPPIHEACSHNLAPTTSTTLMLAMGDALALVVSDERGFAARDFARLHPGGSLGRKLKLVDEVMRPLSECRIATTSCSIREVLVQVTKPGRRSGAVMLVDAKEKLVGIFTDSDLARLLEKRRDEALDECIEEYMSRRFTAVHSGANLTDAIALLAHRKVSELPVILEDDRPIGMIDITDILTLMDQQALLNRATAINNGDIHHDSDEESPSFPSTIRLFS